VTCPSIVRDLRPATGSCGYATALVNQRVAEPGYTYAKRIGRTQVDLRSRQLGRTIEAAKLLMLFINADKDRKAVRGGGASALLQG
jgi:hypothetical protein